MKPALIVHCDWSTEASKRWLAGARLSSSGCYEVTASIPVGSTDSLFTRLREKAPSGAILAGFDFPIGVPRAFAEKAGFGRFPDMLLRLGTAPWADFYNPAERPHEISPTRPFYPKTPGGSKKQHLIDGLGLRSSEELLRQCDRRTAKRGNACEIFWTLGANQVGRAAIQGWRDLLARRQSAVDPSLFGHLTEICQFFSRLLGLRFWKPTQPRPTDTSDSRGALESGGGKGGGAKRVQSFPGVTVMLLRFKQILSPRSRMVSVIGDGRRCL
jgi:hypothetical protein